MRFSLLGPLEAVGEVGPVPLGGINQRAALGFLLLHANSVVATSDLVQALWGDDVPATARKMVQNAVAGLRRALSEDGTVTLMTAQPGYVLRVDPERIDVTLFHTLVDRGRADFRAGAWEPAARQLRQAVALWRGPALADVTQTGDTPVWPELTMLDEARLTALEDCLEAELALGRHHELIGEMTSLVEEEPARERLSGLLMLALYRCGRQQEALAVYQRLREILREGFGLDPAPKLREMERAVLNQHPCLALPPRMPQRAFDALGGVAGRAAAGDAAGTDTMADTGNGGVGTLAGPPDTTPDGLRPHPASPGRAATGERPAAERKRASILLVRTGVDAATDDPESLDETLQELARVIHEEARRFGGFVRETLGSVRPVVFGFPQAHEDDPERAVHAALAIRDRLAGSITGRLTVRFAVATGEVLATYRDEGDPAPAQLSGTAPDAAALLLAHARPGVVRVCRATADAIGLPPALPDEGAPADGGREVTLPPVPGPFADPSAAPLVGRDRELEILRGLLGDVRRRQRPHLVTVIGEPGIGRSRLVAGFVAGLPALVLTGRTPPFAGTPLAPLADSVRSRPGGPRLAREIERLPVDSGAAVWRRHVEELAAGGPVLVVLEDLHRADTVLLDIVEDLTERLARVPLLVVATARPELRQRRTNWGCGKRDVTTVTLDPLCAEATATLLPGPADPALLTLVGGNPRFAEEYARAARERANGTGHRTGDGTGDAEPAEQGAPPVPERIRTLIAARIDTLSLPERVVLRDAAIFADGVRPTGVSALSDRGLEETAELLHGLERKDFLVRQQAADRPGEAEDEAAEVCYAFRQPLLRKIAHAQLPRRDRIARHRRAITWITGLPAEEADLLVHHYRQLLALTASRTANDLARQAYRALVDAERRAAAAGAHDTAARCRQAALELRPAPARHTHHRPQVRHIDDASVTFH
ncbi:BTAD domain-containing putative transcriptional regulator [Spirillospora sp. CA-255316]